MTKETLLMQYQSECLSALKSVVNIHKPFEKTFIDAMNLFMAIPDRINFLQLGRYGCFSEQTYRNLFENETINWFAFNGSIISKHLTGRRKAIAIDPSYILKSGHKTLWIGYFWLGCVGDYKRGLEIMGIGVIDIDNHECMTLGSIQTPDCKTLDNMGKNLVNWYSSYLISKKEEIQSISKMVVADAFFSKETFITPMCESDYHVISRFRNDVILYYPTLEKEIGKRGHPKWFDGKIDFANLYLTRCKEYKVNKGKLYGLRVMQKLSKDTFPYSFGTQWTEGQISGGFFLYIRFDGCEVLDYYRTRFQLEFCFRDSKQHAGITNYQSTDFRKLNVHFNASLAAVNLAKVACKKLEIRNYLFHILL